MNGSGRLLLLSIIDSPLSRAGASDHLTVLKLALTGTALLAPSILKVNVIHVTLLAAAALALHPVAEAVIADREAHRRFRRIALTLTDLSARVAARRQTVITERVT